MKKILLFLALLFISGCTSFGRGVAEAILNKDNTEDHRQCDIIGEKINGINDYFQQNKIVKVMMIHGVGSHTPGYATRIRENLAKSLDLTVFSKRAKDITLLGITRRQKKSSAADKSVVLPVLSRGSFWCIMEAA